MEAKKFNNLEKMFSNMTDKQRRQYLLDEYSRLIEDKGYDWDKEEDFAANENEPQEDDNKFIEFKRLRERYNPARVETWSYDLKPVTDDADRQQSVANYPLDHQIYQTKQQSFAKSQGKPYLRFDGQNLHWQDGNNSSASWRAMSGQPWAQDVISQRIADEGPIPEGVWKVDYSSRINANRNKDQWGNRSRDSWGEDLVRVTPQAGTHTYGRSGFNIHGGKNFGSEGCIDLSKGSSDFMRYLDDYGNDMDLVVEYKNLPLSKNYKK